MLFYCVGWRWWFMRLLVGLFSIFFAGFTALLEEHDQRHVWGKYIKLVFRGSCVTSTSFYPGHVQWRLLWSANGTNRNLKEPIICLSVPRPFAVLMLWHAPVWGVTCSSVWRETNAHIPLCDVVWSKNEKGNCPVLPLCFLNFRAYCFKWMCYERWKTSTDCFQSLLPLLGNLFNIMEPDGTSISTVSFQKSRLAHWV